MARCNSCSAPLTANSVLCRYCGIRNDIDLHGKYQFILHSEQSDRICPLCNKSLQTIDLDINGPFLIERCDSCYGLFFDPGEIETFLESSVSGVFHVNRELIGNINKDRYQNKQIKYIQCPVCRILMNRVSFGHRSGVVIDQCKQHGIWLDNGEITHLMEWKKAGGQILHQKKKSEKSGNTRPHKTSIKIDPSESYSSRYQEPDIIETVASLVFKLFD